jgi:hypothetical protein
MAPADDTGLLTPGVGLTIRPADARRPGSKVVMQGTANPLYGGSIPPPASTYPFFDWRHGRILI